MTQPFLLQPAHRLSSSLLWGLQRKFFERQGRLAWSRGTVPHYITTNPFIASSYARVVVGFLRDLQANASSTAREPKPLYIVELGAGTGRFGFLFLRELARLTRRERLPPWRYIMTDLAEANVDFFQAHTSLSPFVEEGLLDFARVDTEHDHAIHLRVSGQTLRRPEGGHTQPMVAFANYLFDSIPQDFFTVQHGQLQEGLISLSSLEPSPSLEDPSLLQRLLIRYEHQAAPAPYYEDPLFEEILRGSSRATESIQFPIAGLRLCRWLGGLSGGHLLLLSADKVRSGGDEQAPHIVMHGSFSLTVDYRVIQEYFARLGGLSLSAEHHQHLAVNAFLLGGHSSRYTREAFEDFVERFGPDDFFALKKAAEVHLEDFSLSQLLALIRLGGHDVRLASQCLPRLGQAASGASPAETQALIRTIRCVWENYYDIGEELDLAFGFGSLMYRVNAYQEAVRYFEASLERRGLSPHTCFNIGLCHYQQKEHLSALGWIQKTLELQPEHPGANLMLQELQP